MPTAGFVSAQLMCLRALITKYVFTESDGKLKLLEPVLSSWPPTLLPLRIKPGPGLTFLFVACVPHSETHFTEHGIKGWFALEERLLLTFSFDQCHIPVFAKMGLWDSHPEGKVGKIVNMSVQSQRDFLL